MRSQFRDLVAYQLASALTVRLHQAIATWSKVDQWWLGVQLLDAAGSVGANIAEAAGRLHPKDRRRILGIARGSLYEVEHWLATAEELGLVSGALSQPLEEIARTLEGLINKQST